jgi:hypothetical protein
LYSSSTEASSFQKKSGVSESVKKNENKNKNKEKVKKI